MLQLDNRLRKLLIRVILKYLHNLLINRVFIIAIKNVNRIILEILKEKTAIYSNEIVYSSCGTS